MNVFTVPREIATLVSVPELLRNLGFEVNERARRARCLLHSGSNPTAFAWREDGRWHCFVCGKGGDRIALVIAVRQCSFRDAVAYLAQLAGVEFRARSVSRREIEHRQQRRERAERAAWRIADEIGRLRGYYTDALHRTDRLQSRIGKELLRSGTENARDSAWNRLARLAPACTFFFASWHFLCDATPNALARFALAKPSKRRAAILEGDAL
jgi:phage/plasmid primase-like uncharacterized protein